MLKSTDFFPSKNYFQIRFIFHCLVTSTQCGKYGNSLSPIFEKNSMKLRVLLNKLLKSWFDEIFFGDREFLVCPHCVLFTIFAKISWNRKCPKIFHTMLKTHWLIFSVKSVFIIYFFLQKFREIRNGLKFSTPCFNVLIFSVKSINHIFREFIDAKINVKSTISLKLVFQREIDESVFILIEKGYLNHSVEIHIFIFYHSDFT